MLASLSLSADGKLLAWGESKGTLCLWDVAAARLIDRFVVGADAAAFSPDGRLLVTVSRDVILWELATRKEVRRYRGHRGQIRTLAFSPDGRRLVSGSDDTTALIWDVTGLGRERQENRGRLSGKDRDALFDDLASVDASRGQRAVWTLAAASDQAVRDCRERVRPESLVTPARIEQLIKDLDSDRFDVRDEATRGLERLEARAEASLRKALAGRPSAEVRHRAEGLLETLSAGVAPSTLRAIRAVAVLEYVGTPDAREVLEYMTKGAPEARLTREAKAALERLIRRAGEHQE